MATLTQNHLLRTQSRTRLPTISSSTSHALQQTRGARLLRRPKRPYVFTQLVTLTDGSAYLQRTMSPIPVYRSAKDNRNAPLWNPSSLRLRNIEEDDAGKLAAFRAKFGRGWDAEGTAEGAAEETTKGDKSTNKAEEKKEDKSGLDSLMDLISSAGAAQADSNLKAGVDKSQVVKKKSK